MHILDTIVAAKRKEISLKKSLIPVNQLESSVLFDSSPKSLVKKLTGSQSGIIAEHKRRSPSKSVINNSLSVNEVVTAYEKAGVCGISVLTDNQFFGGSLEDLLLARASVNTPLLRKEFIIDEYQLVEAKAYGADIILLIAAILKKEEIRRLSKKAGELGLEVLLEIHNEEELDKICSPDISLVGVNNRNLKTFEVSIDNSIALAPKIPEDFIKISESGLDDHNTITELQAHGYKGFLIGETFMRTEDPGITAVSLIKKLEA